MMISVKNITSYSKIFFPLFWKFLIGLVCVPSFKSINGSSLSRKKYDGGNFTHVPCQILQGQNTLVGIGLIELTKASDILNYKPFSKHCILQTILHVSLLFMILWKTGLHFTFCWFGWGSFGVTVLKVLSFYCSFFKVIGN